MTSSYLAGVVKLARAAIPAVGSGPLPVPTGATFPYVTVREITTRDEESLSGPSDVNKSMMQVDVWDKNYDAAWAARKAIKDYILAFSGAVAGLTGLTVQGANHGIDTEFYEADTKLHQLITRIVIHWEV